MAKRNSAKGKTTIYKHAHQATVRVTLTPLIPEGEPGAPEG
jgi:hypothetical protein